MNATWPTAVRGPRAAARFKSAPDEFQVDETLAFEPSGRGQHLYLLVEKRELGTPEAAAVLARVYGCDRAEVGYAGMKDKHAVTRQWFSVPTQETSGRVAEPRLRVLASARHHRKLRRGELASNSFAIVLRGLTGDADWTGALERVRDDGAPNYFGPQRFGRENLANAVAWLPDRRRRPVTRFTRGLYLSVVRAFLFNEVLGRRVGDGTWRTALPGDVLVDGVPTGPLWGRGRSEAAAEALRVETDALAGHAGLCEGLEHAGLRQQRRALVLRAGSFRWERAGDRLNLRFTLPPGGYATVLLAEAFDLEREAE